MQMKKMTKILLSAGVAVSLFLGGCTQASGLNVFDTMKKLQEKTTKPAAAETRKEEPKVQAGSARLSPIVRAAQKVGPAVVGITNKRTARDFFNRLVDTSGTGSGVIYKADGYIVTNHHVIDGAKEIIVQLSDGRELPAKLLGSDVITDLAVIKVEAKNLPTVVFGDSDAIMVGETAIAIGNPLGLEYRGTVTVGVVSALNRTVKIGDSDVPLIQTDAAINPGNSGGALVNADGEVIGINSRKVAAGGIEGLGFSIPSNIVKGVVKDLERNGVVTRPYLGVYLMDKETLDKSNFEYDLQGGVLVYKVAPNSPIAKAGIKPMDVITKLNGEKVTRASELRAKLFTHNVGDEITLTVVYRGEEHNYKVVLGTAPNPVKEKK